MGPLNLGETLDASIKIVRARWRTLALVILVVAVPLQVIDLIITASTTDTYTVRTGVGQGGEVTYNDQSAYIGGQVVIVALTFLSYLLGTAACFRAVADAYLDRDSGPGESLRFAVRRLGATMWLTIVVVVGLVLAFIALVIPGLWLMVAWSVALPVLFVEGKGGFKALGRSAQLVKDRWWATFGRFFVGYILVSVVSTAVTLLWVALALLVVDKSSLGALVLQHIGSLFGSLVTTPFIAALTVLIYFDLRVRKEGFDLALLAERMGGVPAEGPAPEPAVRVGAPAPPRPEPMPGVGGPDFGGWAPPVAPEPQPRPPAE